MLHRDQMFVCYICTSKAHFPFHNSFFFFFKAEPLRFYKGKQSSDVYTQGIDPQNVN